MLSATTDLCDANEDKLGDGTLQALPPGMLAFGKKLAFAGRIKTVRAHEDNTVVRAILEVPAGGNGQVLVVDGGGSRRCALLGGNLAELAEKNGWAGIVVHGCIRDADEVDACNIGVRALATHPVKSRKRGQGEEGVTVDVLGVRIRPNDWCYADRDGVLVSHVPLS